MSVVYSIIVYYIVILERMQDTDVSCAQHCSSSGHLSRLRGHVRVCVGVTRAAEHVWDVHEGVAATMLSDIVTNFEVEMGLVQRV